MPIIPTNTSLSPDRIGALIETMRKCSIADVRAHLTSLQIRKPQDFKLIENFYLSIQKPDTQTEKPIVIPGGMVS